MESIRCLPYFPVFVTRFDFERLARKTRAPIRVERLFQIHQQGQEMGNVRKPYEKPGLTNLTPEQAKQNLA